MQETRVEYFRGKDFTVFLRNYPEVKEILAYDKDIEVADIINTLLMKNLLVRCDRVVKTVRPGKKKLSSFPAHLEIHFEQVFSENDVFFAWTFMKRRTLWQTILSFLWPLVALAVCLFPVYPYQCKIVVLYTCAGALLFLVTLLLIRGAIFGILYIILGKRIWFFPNINAEETTFRELIRFWPKKDEEEPPKWTSRITFAIGAALIVILLRHHAPDEAARARYQKKVYNIIDDVLEWSPKLALSGMMEKQHPLANETETNFTKEENQSANTEDLVQEAVDQDSAQDWRRIEGLDPYKYQHLRAALAPSHHRLLSSNMRTENHGVVAPPSIPPSLCRGRGSSSWRERGRCEKSGGCADLRPPGAAKLLACSRRSSPSGCSPAPRRRAAAACMWSTPRSLLARGTVAMAP